MYRVLSLKQPWATLLCAGRKTVEVRRWQTAYRGPVLIHAARVPDDRPHAWAQVPAELLDRTRLAGGIVGAGTLAGVTFYGRPEQFTAGRAAHLNDPDWFEPGGLFGLCFCDLRPLPFYPLTGQVRLFHCELADFTLPPPPVAPATLADPADPVAPPPSAPVRRLRRILESLLGPAPDPGRR